MLQTKSNFTAILFLLCYEQETCNVQCVNNSSEPLCS